MPPSVEQKTVCSISGMLAVPGSCPGITEYFATDILPTERCTGHGYSYDDSDEGEEDEEEDTTDPGTSMFPDLVDPTPTPTPDPMPTPDPTPTPDPPDTPDPVVPVE